MNTKFAIGSILVGALLAPVAVLHADTDQDRSSAKAFVKDSVITAKIKSQFALDKQVRATHVKVDTDDRGVVQLSGTARSQGEADRAVQIAQGVEGVAQVQNNIRIATYRPAMPKQASPADTMTPGGA